MTGYEGYFRSHHGYQFDASEGDRLARWFWRHWRILEPWCALPVAPRVLEIGSGVGTLLCFLPAGTDYVGLELDLDAVETARRRFPQATFLHECVEEFEPSPGSFDLVVATEVLEHLENPSAALRTARRALKREGRFVGSTPPPGPAARRDPTHLVVLEPRYWRRLFERAGFHVLALEPATFVPLAYRLDRRLNVRIPARIPLPGLVTTTFFALEPCSPPTAERRHP